MANNEDIKKKSESCNVFISYSLEIVIGCNI